MLSVKWISATNGLKTKLFDRHACLKRRWRLRRANTKTAFPSFPRQSAVKIIRLISSADKVTLFAPVEGRVAEVATTGFSAEWLARFAPRPGGVGGLDITVGDCALMLAKLGRFAGRTISPRVEQAEFVAAAERSKHVGTLVARSIRGHGLRASPRRRRVAEGGTNPPCLPQIDCHDQSGTSTATLHHSSRFSNEYPGRVAFPRDASIREPISRAMPPAFFICIQ
jgi:hypothetical protein